MSESPDELRDRLLEDRSEYKIETEKAVQLCRIAEALDRILEEGIWTAQLPEPEPEQAEPSDG